MHAWMAQQGFPKTILRSKKDSARSLPIGSCGTRRIPEAPLLRQKIDIHPDPVYGDGFRVVKQSVRQFGIEARAGSGEVHRATSAQT